MLQLVGTVTSVFIFRDNLECPGKRGKEKVSFSGDFCDLNVASSNQDGK